MTASVPASTTTAPRAWGVFALLVLGLPSGCGHRAANAQPEAATAPSGVAPFSDPWVANSVRSRLALESGLDTERIQAIVRRGVVALHGQAQSREEASRAVEAAKLAGGVRAVINYLYVPNDHIPSSTLADNVRAALRDRRLDSSGLQVRADGAKIQLAGSVSSLAQKRAAKSAAWSVYGVVDVQDAIRVVPVVRRDDAEIAHDIKARLAADGYDPSAVQVATMDGIVTLSGEVKGLFDKRRVLERAAVEGVLDVRDRLSVQQEREDWPREYAGIRSAEEMRAAILDAYALDPRVPERAVRVEVRSGVAELRGAVATESQRIAARNDAANTPGIWAVQNQLMVSGAPATDQTLRAELRARLSGHPYVNASDIDVNVERGQVVLTGKVHGSFESRVAERTARVMPGVVSVENRLQLEKVPGNARGDEEIKRDIQAELAGDPLVDISKVDVSVENGVATISGIVENWEVYNAVLENVFEALPLGVVNQLERRKAPQLLYSR